MNTIDHESTTREARFDAQLNGDAAHHSRAEVVQLVTSGDGGPPDLSQGFLLDDRLVLPEESVVAGADGRLVMVEPKVIDVLLHLARANGHLVSRRELLETFWYPGARSEGALTRAICTLRRALGDRARSPRFIATIHKRGYRLLVPVTLIDQGQREEAMARARSPRDRLLERDARKPAAKPSFFEELKRRRVFRVASAYLIAGWVIVQVAETTFEPLGLPEWCLTLLVVLVALGFPLAVVLAWAVQLTRDGPVLEMPVADLSENESKSARSGLRYALLVALLAVIGWLAFELFDGGHVAPLAAHQCEIDLDAPYPAGAGEEASLFLHNREQQSVATGTLGASSGNGSDW